MEAKSFAPSTVLMRKMRYSLRAASPSMATNHARHAQNALRVGNIVTFDAPRRVIHADRLGQRLTCADGALVRAGKVRVALGQRVLRILERQLYKLVLRAALRLKHRDLRALPLRERQRDVFRLFGQLHARISEGGCLPSS